VSPPRAHARLARNGARGGGGCSSRRARRPQATRGARVPEERDAHGVLVVGVPQDVDAVGHERVARRALVRDDLGRHLAGLTF